MPLVDVRDQSTRFTQPQGRPLFGRDRQIGGRQVKARQKGKAGLIVSDKAKSNSYRAEPFRLNSPVSGASILGLLGKLLLAVALLTLLGAVSIGLLFGYDWATSHPYFALKTITVSGGARMSETDIIKASGVEYGSNSLALNMREIEARLLASPWVKSVYLGRELPNTLRIQVLERQARFWVRKDDRMHYADQTGNIIAPVEQDKFTSLPVLEVEGEEVMPKLDRLPELMSLIESDTLPFTMSQVAWMKISGKGGFEIYLPEQDISVSVALEGWRENFQRLGKVWADLARRKELAQVKSLRAVGSKVLVERRG